MSNHGTSTFNKDDGCKKSSFDLSIENKIEEHCKKFNIDPLTATKSFAVLLRRHALKRFLAHEKLFSMSLNVPGDIAELGVYRGIGLFTWANLLECYSIGNRSKVVYGFDNWFGFRSLSPEDGEEDANVGREVGGFDSSSFYEEIKSAIEIFDADRFIPQKPRIKLVSGDIEETVPNFVKENPGTRFSLVHFDCDLYKPTLAALKALWPVVTKGGVVIFDEYALADWSGETKAVDEFFQDKSIKLQNFAFNNTPGAYVIKS